MHDVGFTLGTELAGSFDSLLGAEGFKIAVITNASRDKASLEICMYSAGGFGGGSTLLYGPGAAFFFAGGKETLEAEGFVGGLD